jgi:hypothetical protein
VSYSSKNSISVTRSAVFFDGLAPATGAHSSLAQKRDFLEFCGIRVYFAWRFTLVSRLRRARP